MPKPAGTETPGGRAEAVAATPTPGFCVGEAYTAGTAKCAALKKTPTKTRNLPTGAQNLTGEEIENIRWDPFERFAKSESQTS